MVIHFEKKNCSDPGETLSEWNFQVSGLRVNSTESFWSAVNDLNIATGDKRFEYFLELVLPLLAIPFSNAAVERSFSILNIVKDKLRNRMSIPTADAILKVKYGLQNECQNFIPTKKMLAKFSSTIVYKTPDTTSCEMLDVFNAD